MGKYRARRDKGESEAMSQLGLLVYWLSECSGFRNLLDALQHRVNEHPTVWLAPWSWESRRALFWGSLEKFWLMPSQLLISMSLSYSNSFGLTFLNH